MDDRLSPEMMRELGQAGRYADTVMSPELKCLEHETIAILREVARSYERPAMLFSAGKDSCVLLWLMLKAFLGKAPFTLIHVDTGYKPPELLAFRDAVSGLVPVEVESNTRARADGNTFPDGDLGRVACCQLLKTDVVTRLVRERRLDALVVGIRRDESPVRSKERVFSCRDSNSDWGFEAQPAELGRFAPLCPEEGHVRVHPILEWSELDVWRYIQAERIPIADLYFARQGRRYRTLGCLPCTEPIESAAVTVAEIIAELQGLTTAERAVRAQDREHAFAFEELRRRGYM